MAKDQPGTNLVVLVTDEELRPDARVLHTTRALTRAGLTCHVVSTHPCPPGPGVPHDHVVYRHVPPPADPTDHLECARRFRMPWHSLRRLVQGIRQARQHRRFQRDLTTILIQTDASAYHACGPDALEMCRPAARHNLARLVYDTTASDAANSDRLFTVQTRSTRSDVDAVITASKLAACRWKKHHGVERTLVFRNLPRWKTAPERAPTPHVRGVLELADDVPLLACVVDDAVRPGLEVLFQCLRGLPGFHLALVGSCRTTLPATLRASLDRDDMGRRVWFLDAVAPDDLAMFLRSANVSLVPLPPESPGPSPWLPCSLFASAMAGVPVVASYLPECRDFVLGHGLGRVCHPTDPGAWAHAIGAAHAARGAHRPASFALDERLRHDLCRDREAEALARFYDDLLGRQRLPDRPATSVVPVLSRRPAIRPARVVSRSRSARSSPTRTTRTTPANRPVRVVRVARTPFASRPTGS